MERMYQRGFCRVSSSRRGSGLKLALDGPAGVLHRLPLAQGEWIEIFIVFSVLPPKDVSLSRRGSGLK